MLKLANIATLVRRMIGALGGYVTDVAAIAGVGAITYGFWLIYHPAGWIVGGSLALAGAWLAARKAA